MAYYFISSKRGKIMILDENIFYLIRKHVNLPISYWRCKQAKGRKFDCPVRATLKNGVITAYNGMHNHEPPKAKIEKIKFVNNLKERCSKETTSIPSLYKKAAAAAAAVTDNEASSSYTPTYSDSSHNLYSASERKGETSTSSAVYIKNDPNASSIQEEVVVPDINIQCSESTEMETQSGISTSHSNNSGIVIKQEIVETESESRIYDDPLFHSSYADDPSKNHFCEQTPNTSFLTHSGVSNSNADIFPDGQVYDVTAPTLPGKPPFISNFSGPENEPPGVLHHIGSPSLHQAFSGTSHKRTCNNSSIQQEVSSDLSPSILPRDRFDVFGDFIASKLRNLDSKSSAFIQTTFAELIFKAELGLFANKNNKITAPTSNIQKNTSFGSESEITLDSSRKENIQPIVPTLTDNPHLSEVFNSTGHESSLGKETVQPIPSHSADPSVQPVENISGLVSSFRNESIQPSVTSHLTNPCLPGLNVTDSEISSTNGTSVSSHMEAPSLPQVLNHPSSSPSLQTRVPFHLRSRDEFDVYGEFTASKLRNLDSRSCAFLQTAFADLVFEAELGRFLSEGEKSIFAHKKKDILQNMPPPNDSGKCI